MCDYNRPLIKVNLKAFFSVVTPGFMGYDTENRGTVATNFQKKGEEIIVGLGSLVKGW